MKVELTLHHQGPHHAPAVLWLHGYTMDSSLWAPTWERLPGWHHVGIDLPGHGSSGPLEPGTTRAAIADAIAEVARRVPATRLVALSFGTLMAVELAIRHPDLLSHLVLAAPTFAGAGHDEATQNRYRELAGLRQVLGPGPHLTERWMTSPPDIFTGTLAHPELREAIRRVVDRHTWDELVNGAIAPLTAGEHAASDLVDIRARLLLVVGDEDMPAFRTNAAVLTHAVPGARAVVVPDAGHLALVEAPERLSRVLEEHLEHPGQPAARSAVEPTAPSPASLPSTI